MGLLLAIVSFFLRLVIVPVGVVYGIARSFYHVHFGNGLKYADKKLLTIAKSIDKYGNVACEELFNDCLIRNESPHRFGNISQTISGVLGINQSKGTLTRTGKAIAGILNFIDKDHCLKAAQSELNTKTPNNSNE
jgi:hypothetical protein